MKIRSITCFHDIDPQNPGPGLDHVGQFLATARTAFTDEGIEVQTVRLALPPFARWIEPRALPEFGPRLEAETTARGIDYATVGPARLDDPADAFEVLPDLLAATTTVFTAGELAARGLGLDTVAVRRCAEVIHRAAPLEPDGFANLRFAALANVDPGVPFLPAAYHVSGPPRYAIAMEAADLAVDAFRNAERIDDARRGLIKAIEDTAARIGRVTATLPPRIPFSGLDFSLAPFPDAANSIGGAMEQLGLPGLGASGSVTVAALITSWCNQAQIEHTGFSGLFLPVLEDSVLAARSAEGAVTVEDLLLYSTVCGTGLDTVPLPGDISVEELSAVLLDVAAIALRHEKPLTARLMPMPGKQAGDELHFDFPFFASGRVMAHRARPLHSALAAPQRIPLAPRGK